ncbi:phage tail sheath family protein [Methylobacterium currus]|uniref:Phage tail sheath family protein n=1 Tax=Methylobacterium currus TaxID=2051553 RepID=A0A2R4WMJ8_9HYPH|nr:phage tail sheath subtilisin-like domain-containing protein [Methylobacterium currus]AWB22771.1 phage tail sheath family protein [Methylobacterium currus]
MATSYPNTPGVQILEVRLGAPPIAGVGTSTAGFVGKSPMTGRFLKVARLVTSADQFEADYITGKNAADPPAADSTSLSRAVFGFFENGGTTCYVVNVDSEAQGDVVAGIKLLEPIDEVAIIAAPGHVHPDVYAALEDQAFRTGDRFALLDPPAKVDDLAKLKAGGSNRPPASDYAAFYYPRIQVMPRLANDPKDSVANPIFASPTGHIAGVYARVDAARGVHKAPANERILGALGVEHPLGNAEQNTLNADGVNLIRMFAGQATLWGARTLQAADAADKTFRYINVRRLVNYVEESLEDGLRFAVFEPNNLALRQTITRSVRGFLDGVWRDGALFGATPDEAYYVRFPDLFNRDEDRALGKLTIEIGLRAVYPAEFIIVRIGLIMQNAAAA